MFCQIKMGILMTLSRWWRAQPWSITLSCWAHRMVKSLYQPIFGHNFDSPFQQTALKGINWACTTLVTFSHLKPGTVIVQDCHKSREREICFKTIGESPCKQTDFLPVIPPSGLSLKWQQYLFDKIRVLSC